MKRIALASLLMFASFAVFSAPVYRCGNSYSQAPCAGAAVIDADDPRSASQRAEAQTVAAVERRLGHEMEHERRALEARAPRAAMALSVPHAVALAPSHVAQREKATTKAKARRYVAMTAGAPFIAVAPRHKLR